MLSPVAQDIITQYLNLPFSGIAGVRCPYFNNARLRQRGQLRVLIGKGTPHDIVEEAQIISIQNHAGLFEKDGSCCLHNKHTGEPVTAGEIRKFLIDHNLGIECSGFVTQVLRAHFLETKKIDLTKKFFITSPKHIVRWLISKLRPIENIDVRTYTNNQNTIIINTVDAAQPGDVITMLEIGPNKKRNHILLITENDGKAISYVHARAWSSEGTYGHGVSEGKINIIKPQENVLQQEWIEKGISGEQNETYVEAREAKILEIRRLKI